MEIVYKQLFELKYFGGFSLFESYNLPIGLRNWYTKLLADQLKLESEANKTK
jgi:hypothetical protein